MRECPKMSKIFSDTKAMSVQINTKLMRDIQRFYNLPQKFCLCVFGVKKSIYQRGEDVHVFVFKVPLDSLYLRSLPQTGTAL